MTRGRWSLRTAGSPAAGNGLLEYEFYGPPHLRGVAGHLDAALFHDGELLLRRAFAARDDGAGVAHAFPRRRGDAGDEADDRFFHVVLRPARRDLLVRAADLAHHDHRLGLRVFVEHAQNVEVLQSVDRIAADADAARLAESDFHQLPDRFISQRPGARHDSHRPLLVDVARHDADLDLVGRDHAGAVRPDEQRSLALHAVLGADHVAHRDAFGDADHQVQVRVHRLVDRRGGERGWNVDHGDGRAGGLSCIFHRAIDRKAVEILARLPGIDAGDIAIPAVGIVAPRPRVELAGLAGDALRHHPRALVEEDAHFFAFAAATTFCAASAMFFAEMIGRPESARIFFPSSTRLPSRRTTSGTFRLTAFEAFTRPSAITSHSMMPPKMFTRIALSDGLRSMILNASVTFSVVAPPPTSRKLAGAPP